MCMNLYTFYVCGMVLDLFIGHIINMIKENWELQTHKTNTIRDEGYLKDLVGIIYNYICRVSFFDKHDKGS